MILRVPKEETVFLYQLLEGYDGVANFSTLPFDKSQGYRDIEIYITEGMQAEFNVVLENLRREIDFTVLN